MTFDELESKYYELKGRHAGGLLGDEEFLPELEKLSLQDSQGRWWMIGAKTGKWYVSREGEWVQAEPPRAAPSAERGCPNCGAPVKEDALFCASCGYRLVAEPAAPAQAPARPTPRPPVTTREKGPIDYEGVGRRAVAATIDGIVFSIVYFVVSFVIFLLAGRTKAPGFEVIYVAIGLSSLLAFGYFVVLEATTGATLGKMALGMRVVKEDGSPCDWKASLIRNLLRVIDGLFGYLLGAILIWTSDKTQRLGDRVAKTVVISTR